MQRLFVVAIDTFTPNSHGLWALPFSSQTFLPLDVARYLVIVAPDGPDGMPDPTQARGFVVDGNTGITYDAGTWHHAMIVLDRPGCFAVLMWREGTPEDMETVSLDELLHVPAI